MVRKKRPARPPAGKQRPFANVSKKVRPARPAKDVAKVTTEAAPLELSGARDYDHLRDVKPLPGKAQRIPATVSSLEPRAAPRVAGTGPDLDAPARAELARLVSDGLRFEVTDDGHALEGRRLDVDPREIRRLRLQRYPADGTLDLHGHGEGAARRALEAFVRRRRLEGDRAVCIIHGKGNHSRGGVAVLRGEIGAWLSQGTAARDVLAFASIAEPDGTSGALLVLLAKR